MAGIKYYGLLNLAPGEYTLRTLVRDNETGRYGVSVTPLNVTRRNGARSPCLRFSWRRGVSGSWCKGKPRNEEEKAAEYPFAIGGDSFVPSALAGVKSGETSRSA